MTVSASAHGMPSSKPVCPFLGTLGKNDSHGEPIDYPSFENRCLATERADSLMLTDQATFCLSSGHRYCPRFVATHAATSTPPAGDTFTPIGHADLDSDVLTSGLADLEADIHVGFAEQRRSKTRWGWIGAAAIFMSSLICGGVFAAYIGWQLVNRDLLAAQPGTVDTLASAPTPVQPQIYLVVTATSAPQATQPPNAAPAQGQAVTGASSNFPPAVTPTPVVVNPGQVQANANSQTGANLGSVSVVNGNQAQIVQVEPNTAAGETGQEQPAINMQLEIPTRRPTPVFDIPTSTPSEPTATFTPTPVPIFGTPMVIFAAKDPALEHDHCTTVKWDVENVRAVYYENLGVDGHGSKKECVHDNPGLYTLTIVLPNGGTQIYTTTVELIEPTATPTPRPTDPPLPVFTPTWTPTIPTATPTPSYHYSVLLAASDASHQTCKAGESCNFGLVATNNSDVTDDISIELVEAGAWPAQVCRPDGVCSGKKLTLVNVGQGNSAFVRLVVNVPADAKPQKVGYSVARDERWFARLRWLGRGSCRS